MENRNRKNFIQSQIQSQIEERCFIFEELEIEAFKKLEECENESDQEKKNLLIKNLRNKLDKLKKINTQEIEQGFFSPKKSLILGTLYLNIFFQQKTRKNLKECESFYKMTISIINEIESEASLNECKDYILRKIKDINLMKNTLKLKNDEKIKKKNKRIGKDTERRRKLLERKKETRTRKSLKELKAERNLENIKGLHKFF